MSLTEAVKAEARRLGFERVGVTPPDPLPHVDVFERWLEAGRHGEMAYLSADRSRQRRANLLALLPECRSILALAMPYPAPQYSIDLNPGLEPQLSGRVAAYAWNEDYHEVLADRLRSLVAFIERQAGVPVPNRWYTDTGPILERDLAQRAGLGWIGKNTCLIHPKAGSYFLLAEILLGIDLEPDSPFITDHCGSCTRCLEACPTGCILPDRTLDARRCISYLTIELKDTIPLPLRTQMGEWVFGCDVCQQVCPWNLRFAALDGDPSFNPAVSGERANVPRPNLVQELSLTPEAFNRKFKGSPVKRARRRGYLRNVAVALGNACAGRGEANPAVVEALQGALAQDPEPLVREHAAWALGRVGGESARRALAEAAVKEADARVLEEIHAALREEVEF